MKTVIKSLIILLIFLTASFMLGIHYMKDMLTSPGPLQEDTLVFIERGSSSREIARMLEEKDVLSNRLLMIATLRLNPELPLPKAGEYLFPAQISALDVLAMLGEGDVVKRQVTIPEGLTSVEIVNILNETEFLSGEIAEIPEEGSLMPETYAYIRGDTREDMLRRMKEARHNALNKLWEERDPSIPLQSMSDAVILASIVEKETGLPNEHANVAGVFINRLNQGMRLQSDPTVIYALTEGKQELGRALTRKDWEVDSLFNTYVITGLPPSPICNPGNAALKAVLNPTTHDFFYFVADGTGGHAFAKTLAEHNVNVAKWRQIRDAQ